MHVQRLKICALFVLVPTLAQAEVSASRVRPIGHKLEDQIASLADTPEEAKEYKALVPFRYSVVEDDEINAFSARTRNMIVVNRGILDLVESEDELAFVIGHEVGHMIVGQMKKVELEKLQEEWQIENEAMLDELLADVVGVMLIDKAGFDSDAAVKFFKHMISQRGALVWVEIWLRDKSSVDDVHLLEEARLKLVSAMAEQLREEEEEALRARKKKAE